MEKAKLIELFSAYAKNFDFDDPIISLKYNHSLSVANMCQEIAETLAMNEEEKMLAYFIGLVHEFGSFENWKKTKTYQDTLTTKTLLFQDKWIEKFPVDQKYYPLIELAIGGVHEKNDEEIAAFTSSLENGKEKQDEIVRFQNILVDANILDLFGMMKRKSLPVVHATNTKESLSKSIFKNFKTENKANPDDVKSKVDEVIYFLSLYYDLKFPYSQKHALKIDFAGGIYDYYFPELNDKDKERLGQIIQNFKQKEYQAHA